MGLRWSLALAMALLVLASCSQAVPDIKSRCTACKCIADQLRERMEDEKPRNHLDLRHRLDQTGKRYGKVIDYKISELRAVELLDGICDQMKNYIYATFTISASGKTTQQWDKWMGKDATAMINSTRFAPNEEQLYQKQLSIYCGAVMEEYEEELEQAIMKGKFEDTAYIADFLCTERVKACPDGTVPRSWVEEPPKEQEQEGAGGDAAAPSTEAGEGAPAVSSDAAAAAAAAEEGVSAATTAAEEERKEEL